MIRQAKYILKQSVLLICLSALAALALVSVGAQEQTERNPLNTDAPVTARLSKGETHRHPLIVTAGQFVQVQAKQPSADITLELTHPDGNKLMRFKILNQVHEGDSVITLAEEPPSYYVNVTEVDQKKDGIDYQVRMS